MDSDAEWTANFTCLKKRSHHYPHEALHESFPSTPKSALSPDSVTPDVESKFERKDGVAPTPDKAATPDKSPFNLIMARQSSHDW
jgi:hypothetical protein